LPVSFRQLGVTSLALSAHKLNGPKGIGALIVRHDSLLKPQLHGGHQQHGKRPGTEPVPLAVGLAVALKAAAQRLDAEQQLLWSLRRRFLALLRDRAAPVILNGPEEGGLPGMINLSFPGCAADMLLMKLDLAGVACSTGSACSSGSLSPSPVIRAMGVSSDVLRSALRFSLGHATSLEEIEEAARRVIACVHSLRTAPRRG